MNKNVEIDADVSVKLSKNNIIYNFDDNHEVMLEDFVAIYVDDYEIDRSEVCKSESSKNKFSVLKLDKLPLSDFPLEIRGMILGKNIVLPSIFFKNADDILNIVQWSGSDAKITSLTERELTCEVTINSLPSYRREFVLFVNETVYGLSSSDLSSDLSNKYKKTNSEKHKITFKLEKKIRERDEIKIIDRHTSSIILNIKIDWYVLANIMSDIIEENKNNIVNMKEEIRQISKQVKFIASTSLEKNIFERVDIYYSLLNSKINRINTVNNSEFKDSVLDQAVAIYNTNVHNQIDIALREVEGIGIYELESEDDREWKWVGPRVTLALKNVPQGARFITLSFWNFKPETNCKGILIDINGRLIKIEARKISDLWELNIPLAHHISRIIDETAIIHIQFTDFYHSDADTRLLSAVLSSARYDF